MKIEELEKVLNSKQEGSKLRIVLNNNWTFTISNATLENDSLKFSDKFGQTTIIDPAMVTMISTISEVRRTDYD